MNKPKFKSLLILKSNTMFVHMQSNDLILLTSNLWHHIWFEIWLHKNERVSTFEMPFIIFDFAIDRSQGVWLTGDPTNHYTESAIFVRQKKKGE